MYRNIALILTLVVYSHMCVANPVPEPEPYGHHKTHIRIHVPHEVHTLHHHHIEKVPVLHEVPVIKHVPIVHEVPVVKHVPFIQTVHVPIVKTLPIEKPVFVPVPYKESISVHHSSWH